MLEQPAQEVFDMYKDYTNRVLSHQSEDRAIEMITALQREHEYYANWATLRNESLQLQLQDLQAEFDLRVDYAKECRALQAEVNGLKSEIRMRDLKENPPTPNHIHTYKKVL